MPKQSYTSVLKRNKEMEKELESLRPSYEATLLSMKEKIQQMQVDIANHEINIVAHIRLMFGGKDYTTEEVAGTLSSMINRPK